MKRPLWLVAAVVAVMIGTAGCAAPANPTTTTIGLTYIPNIQFAPFYNADQAGWGEAGAVVLRHHGSSEGLFTALTSGQEQLVVAGGDEILAARSQGIDVMAVAAYYRRYPVRLIVPADSPIQTTADLKGHTIGLPGRYGESWYGLVVALRQAGLTEQDVTIADIGYTQQAALSTGQVDAVVGFANSDQINFATAGFPTRAIDPQVPLVSICLATSTAWAQDHPQTLRQIIAAMERGMRQAIDDPASTLTNAGHYIPGFRDQVLAQAEQVLPATTALFVDSTGQLSPVLDDDGWRAMAEAMIATGFVDAGLDPTQAYSNAYQ